jgi:hypothetical protein
MLFQSDEYFRAAGGLLEFAMWMSNPIDALYYVHRGIVGIQKGAIIHRHKGEETVAIEAMTEFLCFDDLFALLFGTVLGTGLMHFDIYYIAWFIEKFAPRESLSPAFDYAKATVEGLASHCGSFDIDAFSREHRADGQAGQ